MRLLAVVPIALVALLSIAHAETSVAVVVSGPEVIVDRTNEVADIWFKRNKLSVVEEPLSKDGLKTLMNCFLLADMACARGVVEARAKATDIIGITMQVSGKKENRSIQLAAYWIAKQHEVVSLQRTCDACTDNVLQDTLEDMLDDLAKLAPTMGGKIHVTSIPSHLHASVDGDTEVDDTTPFDRDVSYGSHVISVMRDGRVVAQKKVNVRPGATLEVPIEVPDEPKAKETTIKIVQHEQSHVGPVVLLTVGVAATLTGGVLYWYGGPTGTSYTYRNMRPAGVATAISGGVAVIIGAVWLSNGGSKDSQPEVSINSTTATIGWARTF